MSAFSRTQLDVSLDFQNKRDNPLFWVDGSPRSEGEGDVKLSKFDGISSKSVDPTSAKTSSGVKSGRGRTVSRSGGGVRSFSVVGTGGKNNSGRSLSRIDTGLRHRSPSRGRYGNIEREREQESRLSSDVRSKNKITSNSNRGVSGEKNKLVRSASDLSELLESWDTWSSQHRASDTADDSPISLSGSRLPRWDDGGSTGSISEAEEKTIIPVSEVKKTSHFKYDSHANGEFLRTVCTDVRQTIYNMQDDLKNCEERARKLRAELAVEEYRELELSKILNDIIPEPKTPQVQKPRAVRKGSMERRKMSKRLEEEAMAYFDECVSISTFDDSDFSSLEDPPSHTTRADVACPSQNQDLRQSEQMQCTEDSGLPSNPNCYDSPTRSSLSSSKTKPEPPVTRNASLSISLEQDIKNYVKNFPKGSKRENSNPQIAGTTRKITECISLAPVEELMLDRVIFRSRIESGCMLLCGDGFGLSGASFAAIL